MLLRRLVKVRRVGKRIGQESSSFLRYVLLQQDYVLGSFKGLSNTSSVSLYFTIYIRYEWKTNLIETLKVRSEQAPVDFTTSSSQKLFDDLEEYKCRRILIEGVYDHENEIVLGLRTAPAGLLGPAAQGLASNPQGYFIITPFLLPDG
jgi:hypothetical protein